MFLIYVHLENSRAQGARNEIKYLLFARACAVWLLYMVGPSCVTAYHSPSTSTVLHQPPTTLPPPPLPCPPPPFPFVQPSHVPPILLKIVCNCPTHCVHCCLAVVSCPSTWFPAPRLSFKTYSWRSTKPSRTWCNILFNCIGNALVKRGSNRARFVGRRSSTISSLAFLIFDKAATEVNKGCW